MKNSLTSKIIDCKEDKNDKMKSKRTIAIFAIVLIAFSMLLVNALSADASNSKASDKSSVLSDNILPIPQVETGNFIMWTSDGKNLIWGIYSLKLISSCGNNPYCPTDTNHYYSGTFEGRDNIGNKLRGSFVKNTFSGYYVSNSKGSLVKSFSGSYENGTWKAAGLFGQKESEGEYKFFPMPIVIQDQNNVRRYISEIGTSNLKNKIRFEEFLKNGIIPSKSELNKIMIMRQ